MKAAARERLARWRTELKPLLTLALFAAALWVIDHELARYRFADIARALSAVRPGAVALALVLAALGYLALVGYDWIAFRFVGRPLPLRAMLLPSFVTFAVSNSAPASVLTAGGVRYRMYAGMQLTPAEAASVAGFNVVTYALGLCLLSGLLLLARPLGSAGPLPSWLSISGRTLGVLLLLAVAAYFGLAAPGRRRIAIAGHALTLPGPRVALQQLAVSLADWLLSSAVLYVLLADFAHVGYLDLLTRFLVAAVAALLLPIPGGLGVFEAVVLLLTSAGAPAPRVLAALVVYRVVYYLLPLVVAGGILLARGLAEGRRSGQPPARWLAAQLMTLAPHVLAFTTFLAGWLLMLTGTIPSDDRRLTWLANLLPLSIIETSHFLASVVGAMLLIVAWGLERRVRVAYRIARVLFGAGIVLTLLRSFDLGLAAFLALALSVLVLADRAFPRETSLLREPVSPAWVFAIGAALVLTLWVGVFAYQGASPSNEVWWHFTLYGHAPRALRAAAGMSVAVLLFALARLLVRAAPRWPRGSPEATSDGGTRAPEDTSRAETPKNPRFPRGQDEPRPA